MAWCCAQIDGVYTLFVSSGNVIHILDAHDFSKMDSISKTGHDSLICGISWTSTRGYLASISSFVLTIHCPKLNDKGDVEWDILWTHTVNKDEHRMQSVSWSYCSNSIVTAGKGITMWDIVTNTKTGQVQYQQVWSNPDEICDQIALSSGRGVFATYTHGEQALNIWRRHKHLSIHAATFECQLLDHATKVISFHWKPLGYLVDVFGDEDGSRAPFWFEPERRLATLGDDNVIRIWAERDYPPEFYVCLYIQPTVSLEMIQWLDPMTRNISDEQFHHVHEIAASWLVGVDSTGIMHLWKIMDSNLNCTSYEKTKLQLDIAGEERTPTGSHNLIDFCVTGYFAQNLLGNPSNFRLILNRVDHVMLYLEVSAREGFQRAGVTYKSWRCAHSRPITALASHPCLPLIASMSQAKTTFLDGNPDFSFLPNEVMVYWTTTNISVGDGLLIPSGILDCTIKNGYVSMLKWLPTPHSSPIPLLLVVYSSGVLEIHGIAHGQSGSIVRSPSSRFPVPSSPVLCPWTYYVQSTVEDGMEYEVLLHPDKEIGVGLVLDEINGKIIATKFKRDKRTGKKLAAELCGQISLNDEFIGVNGKDTRHKSLGEVLQIVRMVPSDQPYLLRFRAVRQMYDLQDEDELNAVPVLEPPPKSRRPFRKSQSTISNDTTCELSSDIQQSLNHLGIDTHLLPNMLLSLPTPKAPASAGSVSLPGGWSVHGVVVPGESLSSVDVAPLYSDDGDYIEGEALIFALSSSLHLRAWRVSTISSAQVFTELQIEGVAPSLKMSAVCTERDYTLRTFQTTPWIVKEESEGESGLNCILYTSDDLGHICYWACRIVVNKMELTIMNDFHFAFPPTQTTSTISLDSTGNKVQKDGGNQVQKDDDTTTCVALPDLDQMARDDRKNHKKKKMLFKRGCSQNELVEEKVVVHIEVADLNRLAMYHSSLPNQLQIWEAESGLGIFRLEGVISLESSEGIEGFCWSIGPTYPKSNALLINADGMINIYSYDIQFHQWRPFGNPIVCGSPFFECTRDVSSLIITPGLREANDVPFVISQSDYRMPLMDRNGTGEDGLVGIRNALPNWHPFALVTRLFGLCGGLGQVDTPIQTDRPTYDFKLALNEIATILKTLSNALDDPDAAYESRKSGILTLCDHDVRQSVAPHAGFFASDIFATNDPKKATATSSTKDKAVASRLFDLQSPNDTTVMDTNFKSKEGLTKTEYMSLKEALQCILRNDDVFKESAIYLLFGCFSKDECLQMDAMFDFIYNEQQSKSIELPADLPVQRCFYQLRFAKCLNQSFKNRHDPCSNSCSSISTTATTNKVIETTVVEESRKNVNLNILNSLTGYNGDVQNEKKGIEMPSSCILWGLHSEYQGHLVDSLIPSTSFWYEIKELWPAMWIQDPRLLKDILERLAKRHFTKEKSAMSVCLPYLALGKKTILAGLAKLSNTTENQNLYNFLQNDFTTERWKSAACKNGYSLLRKKQYEAAMGFFLLPEPPLLKEALRICVIHLKDMSLALLISRVVEHIRGGPSRFDISQLGSSSLELMEHDLLPYFTSSEKIWLESSALSWLSKNEQSIACLIPASFVDQSGMSHCQPPLCPIRAMNYFIDLTSLPLLLQFMHSLKGGSSKYSASVADIEHGFAFASYVCGRSGLPNISLLQMLQARHIIDVHEVSLNGQNTTTTNMTKTSVWPNGSHEFHSSIFDSFEPIVDKVEQPTGRFPFMSRGRVPSILSGRSRSSIAEVYGTNYERDFAFAASEARRLASSAFVSSGVGATIALRLMVQVNSCISMCYRYPSDSKELSNIGVQHITLLHDTCLTLCEQFDLCHRFILESALSSLQPRGHQQFAAIVLVLLQLKREKLMTQWIQYVTLSFLRSCGSLAQRKITLERVRELRDLIQQFSYIQLLSAQGIFTLTSHLSAKVAAAVRVGCILVAWVYGLYDILATILARPFTASVDDGGTMNSTARLNMSFWLSNIEILRRLRPFINGKKLQQNCGYMFLQNLIAHQAQESSSSSSSFYLESMESSLPQRERMLMQSYYHSIVLVQLLRTVYCRLQQLLATHPIPSMSFASVVSRLTSDPLDVDQDFLLTSLLIPEKLWRNRVRRPLEGLKKWYRSIEAHLQEQFPYLLVDPCCLCGYYGMDSISSNHDSVYEVNSPNGGSMNISMDSLENPQILLMIMQDAFVGVRPSQRRFRLDPRVHIRCFTFESAWKWLSTRNLETSVASARIRLRNECKHRRLRLLIRKSHDEHKKHGDKEDFPDEVYMFVNPWEVDAQESMNKYMHAGNGPVKLELGVNSYVPLSFTKCEKYLKGIFEDEALIKLWEIVRGEGWIVTAIMQYCADGIYVTISDELKNRADAGLESKIDYLHELYKHMQRNRLFRQLGLPHRFVVHIEVELVEGRDLVSCNLLSHNSDPYVFLSLGNGSDWMQPATSWNVRTFRSRPVSSSLNPKWGKSEDKFVFRLALPTHRSHGDRGSMCKKTLQDLYHRCYQGPPTHLRLVVFSKTKLRSHPYMGRAKQSLFDLTESTPIDTWMKLSGVSSGSIRVKIALRCQLMCSVSSDDNYLHDIGQHVNFALNEDNGEIENSPVVSPIELDE